MSVTTLFAALRLRQADLKDLEDRIRVAEAKQVKLAGRLDDLRKVILAKLADPNCSRTIIDGLIENRTALRVKLVTVWADLPPEPYKALAEIKADVKRLVQATADA